jgi:hypothetical protein
MPSPALAFMQWLAGDRQNRINRSNTSNGNTAVGIPVLEKALVDTASRNAVPTRPQGLPTKVTMVPDGGTVEEHD